MKRHVKPNEFSKHKPRRYTCHTSWTAGILIASVLAIPQAIGQDLPPPALNEVDTAGSKSDFWQGIGTGAILMLVGGVVTYIVSRCLHKKGLPKKRIVCSATYCEGLLAPSLANFPGNLAIEIGGTYLASPVVVSFHIVVNGDATVNDVRMQVTTPVDDQIIRWQFYVPKEVQCRRMHRIHECANRLEFKWDFLNPRDDIDLVLLISPCGSPHRVGLEIDAEGLKVITRDMRMDCSVGFQG